MNTRGKTYLNWSSGKDSALALYLLNRKGVYAPELLVTVIENAGRKVPIHQIPEELLKSQMRATGLKNEVVEIPPNASNRDYEGILGQKMADLSKRGYRYGVFGDIFLKDIRAYREKQFSGPGIEPLFPLWNKNTQMLMMEMIDLGFKAIVVAADLSKLDSSYVGREVDSKFLRDLPESVDPAGENGEYHTFCYDGPCFEHPVGFSKKEKSVETTGRGKFKMKMGLCELISRD